MSIQDCKAPGEFQIVDFRFQIDGRLERYTLDQRLEQPHVSPKEGRDVGHPAWNYPTLAQLRGEHGAPGLGLGRKKTPHPSPKEGERMGHPGAPGFGLRCEETTPPNERRVEWGTRKVLSLILSYLRAAHSA